MEFSYKPVNPFQDDGLSKEDRAMIDAMRNTAYVCGYRGEDVEYAVHQSLKRMGRYDLLPPCEQENDHKCHTCKHYINGEHDGSCGSYICKEYSDWESEDEI